MRVAAIRDTGEWHMVLMLRRLIGEQRGQDLIEYSLLILFVALAAMSALALFGFTSGQWWRDIGTQLVRFLSGA